MKVVFDFRKYDGIIGGVEQGVIMITKFLTREDNLVVVLCKNNRIENVKKIFAENQNIKIIPLNVTTHSMSLKNLKLDSSIIQDIAKTEKADIIHFFYNWSFPFRRKVPSVLTVHDVIPFTFREAMGFFRNIFLYKPGIRMACRLNNMIGTVSEYSKRDIAEKVGVPLDKIRVIPNGLREPNPQDPDLEKELRKRFEISDSFVLNVGGIHERKNIVRLIYAFSKLINAHRYSGKLLITGNISGAPYQQTMKRKCDDAIKETGMEEKILFTTYISEKELDALLRMAEFLVYPSLYEGFGIPVLEAMKMGLPVITSNTTAMPEVAADAAYLVDPHSVDDMAAAMADLLRDENLRAELRRKGIARARPYTWQRVAEMYLQLYQEVIQRKKFIDRRSRLL
ncbi:MAG: glycosyltransferase family 4 protein [Deltaproteobacteria bacterium]|nr:MAG: glycosyltransferase family 4 protein [Deltaproteobacteria bacterium]